MFTVPISFFNDELKAELVMKTKKVMSFICASVINHDITKVMGH
jgi:hypothetical protein